MSQQRITSDAGYAPGTAPRPANESQRLDALHSYAILDTAAEATFDDIVKIAAQICGTSMALVSLVDTERQWFKARVGIGARETPVEQAICAHAILQPDVFVVVDTHLDSRFAANPMVTGEPKLRFYAGAPLRTSDGYPLGTVCVLDREPRQLNASQLEALQVLARQTMALLELRRSLSTAEAMQKHLRSLMAIAGHDLRQLLQSITMSLEIARLKSGDPLVVRQATAGIAAVLKLGQDLDDLAMASSAVATVVAPKRTEVPVAELFAALEQSWRPQADRKGLRLRFAASRGRIVSNPRLLKSILGNLVGNAIKYTSSGGVLVGCRHLKNDLRITVVDTGMGIAPERQIEMFDAFHKADLNSDGLGLGLAIVRSAVDLLGHDLQLRSIPGKGTIVSVTVPLAASAG
ncbi:MAG: putative two component system sensor protein [Hydrocarboniphaga sp.]|uniref:GAF domain-containing sensor histidine kinase n=1 Tax=Hydrocarboniphaga sp. TaxID=2033016 RepID=UPI00260A2D6C|nr:GAF domain-containing sensor histidine kinase [Hydrocarboniphaga sp.]MDB5971979.1 putative two component system sensor protein [Hydrocarboniphaga sp.]